MNAMIDKNAPCAEFLGDSYPLQPKTLAIVHMMEELVKSGREYNAGKLKYEDVLATQFAFLAATCDGNPFADQALDEVDVDEVKIACTNVIKAYEKRVNRATMAGILPMMPPATDKKKKKKK